MHRIVIGGIVALWGGSALAYGLTKPIARGPYGAGQIAAMVVTACMLIGGTAYFVQGLVNMNEKPTRVRRRHHDRDDRPMPAAFPGWAGMVIGISIGIVVGMGGLIVLAISVSSKKNRESEQAAPEPTGELAPRVRIDRIQPRTEPASEPLASGGLPSPQPPLPLPGLRETKAEGGFMARNDYREYRQDGSILTGFEVGYGKVWNTTVIGYLRPIWLTPEGERYGTAYGKSQTSTVVVKAKEGYAVGGIVIAGGGALEGFALTFMRIGENQLRADDAYTSGWYGEPTRKPRPEAMQSGDGAYVVGLYGKRFDNKGGNNFDDGGAIATIGFVLWVPE